MDISEFSRLDDKSNYNRHPWETSRKNVLHTFLKKSGIEFPIERIVDIGSGDSYVIHTFLEKSIANEYFAIDTAYTPEVISQLKTNNNNSNVNYLQSLKDYEDNFQTDKRTLFLCMDVLEHVEDEKIILDFLKPKLNNQNYYFFAVPAFQSVFSSHDVLLGHYRRYTLTQLNNLLLSNQFNIVDKGYYFTILLLFRKIDKLLKKDKDASIDNWQAGKFKTTLINTILIIDFKISVFLKKIGIIIPGLSCYCLCKK
jgi:2-polyprenyl-3-methyl-5-hydroxy-6-metoxy-1,4-benzoquinol methylase